MRRSFAQFGPGSGRWFVASGLTGLLGSALLVSALYASKSRDLVARRPQRAAVTARTETGDASQSRKADSLLQSSFAISSAQHFRAPLTERSGSREITRAHALTRVSIALSPSPVGNLDIPDFDSARALAGPPREAAQDAVDLAEADVSVTRRDLDAETIPADAPALSDDAIAEQIAEMARLSAGAPQWPPDYSDQRILSRTLRMAGAAEEAKDDGEATGGFGSLDVRIIPENVTGIAPSPDAQLRFADVDVVLDHGETLEGLLKGRGASPARSAAILEALGRKVAGSLPEGQHLRLTIGPDGEGTAIQRVTLFDERGPQQIVASDDHGRFRAVAQTEPGRDGGGRRDEAGEDEDDGGGVSLYQSAYAGALKSEVPRPIIETVIHALAAGADFKQRARAGDRLELVFTDDEGGPAQHRDLLYAGLTVGGETQAIYSYVSSAHGEREFLDKDGVSLAKLLLRRPVETGRISSPFGMRRHPILHYARLHNGVDWASPRGTPIMAAGDGTVAAAGPRSGYGNRVELEHANGYASAYNHMASIGRQIKPGASVHMGEIIGFVGTTGLSTGPHVHYEVTVNGHFVDPMKVKLPSSRILSGAALAEFTEQRRQIDGLRQHADKTLASAHGGQPS